MEQINFKGSVEGKASGEPLSQVDVDFSEGWPEVIRQRQILAANTNNTTLSMGPVTTAKVIALKANSPVYVWFSGSTAANKWECRGNVVAQVSSATVTIKNVTSTSNEVYVFVAGL